jgi:hypothetical protein
MRQNAYNPVAGSRTLFGRTRDAAKNERDPPRNIDRQAATSTGEA